MPIFNQVAKTMDPGKVVGGPTVSLFGWNGSNGALTKDLGQPEGNTMSDMQLDSMKHAIIITRGEVEYRIHSVIPAGHAEVIFILRIPGAVFVSRYFTTDFFTVTRSAIRKEMVKLSGRMNAKIQGISGNDGPYELSVPEGTRLDVYYPKAPTGIYSSTKFQATLTSLGREFTYQSRIKFGSHTYSGSKTEVIVTVPPQSRGVASHRTTTA
ncbi:hypothetical protein UA08_00970 [Talaromyces atroroseus]|uniref:Uncharacterized protein n=1 Tax=Talaromyces atroroseus TaxID=1441469 RepID=A0A225BAE7_TALAT|nr:hypothetical protein UA08_00970 [Talaromyces atroroseus]OKL64356.1 hypothetical protein UA08_00970 [Talaromyces atroroseus]